MGLGSVVMPLQLPPISREISSPLGRLLLVSNGHALTGLYTQDGRHKAPQHRTGGNDALLDQTEDELHGYFKGKRRHFTLPLAPEGTPFQRTVWDALLTIPHGKTWSYQKLAKAIGKAKACRAVGSANGKNPISIIIPCHRVIATDGGLGGYTGGLQRKCWLLAHEGCGDFSPP